MNKSDIAKLDKMWSELVKARDKRCKLCGSDNNLHSHHIITRGVNKTRWSIENGITLCGSCHSDYHAGHKTALINYIGKDKIDNLRLFSKGIYKEKKGYIEEKLKAVAKIEYGVEL